MHDAQCTIFFNARCTIDFQCEANRASWIVHFALRAKPDGVLWIRTAGRGRCRRRGVRRISRQRRDGRPHMSRQTILSRCRARARWPRRSWWACRWRGEWSIRLSECWCRHRGSGGTRGRWIRNSREWIPKGSSTRECWARAPALRRFRRWRLWHGRRRGSR